MNTFTPARRLPSIFLPHAPWRINLVLIRPFEVLEDDEAGELSTPLERRKLFSLVHIHHCAMKSHH